MATPLSAKELRQQLPKIKRRLERGESFELIYRSKPLASITPLSFRPTPKKAFALFANPPKKWLIRSKKSAVQLVRAERERYYERGR